MLGLKTAVAEGDLRVIHLLNWAGLWERVDIEAMVWAIKNAGTNRLNVVDEVFYMWIYNHSMDLSEQSMIGKVLAEIRDQAVVKSDEETVAFVEEAKDILGVNL
jgi:hypothetical protein